jgi:hypothetical protein
MPRMRTSWHRLARVASVAVLMLDVEGQRRFLRVENGRRIYGDEDEWIHDQFIAAMHERKLFCEVERLDAFDSPPDLVATVSRHVDGDNPLPFFTFLTLGIYPTVANRTERLEVSFTAPRKDRDRPGGTLRHDRTGMDAPQHVQPPDVRSARSCHHHEG